MKKFISLLLVLTLAAGCARPSDVVGIPVFKIATIRGPSGVSMLKLMADSDADVTQNKYEFTLFSDPTDITAKILNGEFSAAALPSNLAAVLYQKTDKKIKVVALETLGVLYLLENGNTVKSAADLKGKTVTMSTAGQGATPEFALRYILMQNGLDPDKDVTIEFRGGHSDVAMLMTSGEIGLCLLPEPNVTAVLSANQEVQIALDITREWNGAAQAAGNGDGELAMSCIVASTNFIQSHKEAFEVFLNEYKKSCEYVDANLEETANLAQQYGVIPKAAVAKAAIPRCNIVYIDGSDMKNKLDGYFKVLHGFAPTSVGGELPDENFYYKK